MIKAVLFDFGGVLTEGGKAGDIQRTIAKLCDRRAEEIQVDDIHQKFLRGQITDAEYFDEVNRRYPCASPIMSASFLEGSTIYMRCEPVYDLASELRGHGIKTGVLSNMYPMSAQKLRTEGFYDGFDPVVLSGSERLAKPEPAFFELALERLGLPGNEVLFIDDQERFRPVAESLGMHFITAISPEQIVRDTKALIQKENGANL